MTIKDKYIWIGVGAVIEIDTDLYSELKRINDYLCKTYGAGFGYSEALRPHLNFYDLPVDLGNLDKITKELSEALKNQKVIDCQITGINFFKFGIIFADIYPSEELKDLHQKILKSVNQYRGDCIDPDYAKLESVLSQEQKESLYKYGNPYMLDFRPHITLGYAPQAKDNLNSVAQNIKPMLTIKNFEINKIDFIKGRSSDKIEVISEYNLQ